MHTDPVPKRELVIWRLFIFGLLAIFCGLGLILLEIVTAFKLGWSAAYLHALAVRAFTGLLYIVAGTAEICACRSVNIEDREQSRQALFLFDSMARQSPALHFLASLASLGLFVVVMTLEPYYPLGWHCWAIQCPDTVASLATLRTAFIVCIVGIALVCSLIECLLTYKYAKKSTSTSIVDSDDEPLLGSQEDLTAGDIVKKIVETAGKLVTASDEQRQMVFATNASGYC